MAEWKITLPKDTARREYLRCKLHEYDIKMTERARANPYPYFFPEDRTNTRYGYKFAILHRVLRFGEIDVHRLFDEFEERGGIDDASDYFVAARVIEDCCNTGGKNLIKVPVLNQ